MVATALSVIAPWAAHVTGGFMSVSSDTASSGHQRARRDDLFISTDPTLMDLDVIHGFLSRSYWAAGIPRATVERAMAGSMSFGLFEGSHQIGYARVITDKATFAYLADVFVLEGHRGRGLGKWLVEVLLAHPDLQGLRRFVLATRDAHGLYAMHGFTPLSAPERMMERLDPTVYQRRAP
jgi:GNAT superfamily N-acetyltransferase